MRRDIGSRIGTLRVRMTGRPTPALRLAWSGWAAGLDLMPTGLPPSAVLVLRHLQVTMPAGTAGMRRLDVPTRAGASRRPVPLKTGEQRVRERIARLRETACRPVGGRVPATAEAVLFADENELLACLALCLSEAREPWWTQVPLRSAVAPAAGLASLLRGRIRDLPAIACHLADAGVAHTVFAALTEADAAGLFEALLHEHGLVDVAAPARALCSLTPPAAILGNRTDADAPQPAAVLNNRTDADAPQPAALLPPWQRWLPSPAGLGAARESFLGTALALGRAPSRARSPAFAASLRRWLQDQSAIRRAEDHKAQPRQPSTPSGAASAAIAQASADEPPQQSVLSPESLLVRRIKVADAPARAVAASDSSVATEGASTAAVAAEASEATASPFEMAPPSGGESMRPAGDRSSESRPSGERPVAAVATAGDNREPPADLVPGNDREPAAALADDGIRTRLGDGVPTELGGVLYLVNLLRQLDLPLCFEPEWQLASSPGGWGVLEALGRALLDTYLPAFENDPLWLALSALDDRRPGEPAEAAAGISAADFRLPVGWMEADALADSAGCWADDEDRLALWSATGAVIAEVARNADPAERQALAEWQRLGGAACTLRTADRWQFPRASLGQAVVQTIGPGLCRWLSLALPAIRLCLQHALARPPAAEVVDIPSALLIMPGWLYVTSSHVDFVAGLETVALPVRLAGLDRDPGWVSELGRVVLFHFE